MYIEIIIVSILLIFIYLFFIYLNKGKDKKYLRLYQGYGIIYEQGSPDITKFIKLKEEIDKLTITKNELIEKKEDYKEELSILTESYNVYVIILKELEDLYKELLKSIEDANSIVPEKYSLVYGVDLLYIGYHFNKIVRNYGEYNINNVKEFVQLSTVYDVCKEAVKDISEI